MVQTKRIFSAGLAGFLFFAVLLGTHAGSVSASTKVNGRIAYTDTNNGPAYEIKSILPDATGTKTISSGAGSRLEAEWSPDGTKLVYQTPGNEIAVVNHDGSNPQQLTNSSGNLTPCWSADGTKIIYSHYDGSNYEIFTMNPDGSNQTALTNGATSYFNAKPSPDGTKIAAEVSAGDAEIYVMDADGSNATNVTNNNMHDLEPSWSPDSTKIIFSRLTLDVGAEYEIYTMNPNGTSQSALTSAGVGFRFPTYSPDGTKIAFQVGTNPTELGIMNANGSNIQTVTSNAWVRDLSWQPLTITPSSSNPNPTITVSGTSASVNIPSLYTDAYDGINNASVAVTSTPTKGTAQVNTSTGVITYTQSSSASAGGLLQNISSFFFPKAYAQAANQDSFTYQVCSQSNSSLCATGTVTVTLASSLASTGQNSQLIVVTALALIVAGSALLVRSRISSKPKSQV